MSLCAGCHAGCCRSFAVPVTGADILKVMARQSLSFWDFVCRWADPQGLIARNHAPHFHFRDDPQTPYVICLLQNSSQQFAGSDKCRFLEEQPATAEQPQGTAHCGIYENRPGACRAFPVQLNATSDLAVIYDVPKSGRPDAGPAYQLCPRPWTPDDIDPIQHIQDLVVARYEMNFFHVLAQSWNQQPGSWKLFPDFLQLVYAQRIRPSSELEMVDETDAGPKTIPMTSVYPRIAA